MIKLTPMEALFIEQVLTETIELISEDGDMNDIEADILDALSIIKPLNIRFEEGDSAYEIEDETPIHP